METVLIYLGAAAQVVIIVALVAGIAATSRRHTKERRHLADACAKVERQHAEERGKVLRVAIAARDQARESQDLRNVIPFGNEPPRAA